MMKKFLLNVLLLAISSTLSFGQAKQNKVSKEDKAKMTQDQQIAASNDRMNKKKRKNESVKKKAKRAKKIDKSSRKVKPKKKKIKSSS